MKDPFTWVSDIFGHFTGDGEGRYGLSKQQEGALTELGKLINAKKKAYLGRYKLSDEEAYYAEKIGVSIQSGQGTGKTFFAALCILYFLTVFPNPKIPCTSTSANQLKAVLWAEIRKLMRKSKKVKNADGSDAFTTILEEILEWQTEKVFLKAKGGSEWFAVARTINTKAGESEQAETLSGFHEDFMFIVVDEASGIPEPVFKPLEGVLTGKLNLMLIIYNPTRATGFALESQQSDAKRWVRTKWNAEDSEMVTRHHIQSMLEKYGRESNPYRIRILGLPPVSSSDDLIPWDWIEDAIRSDIEPFELSPVIKGLDCGGGGDMSVIATRKGNYIYDFKRKSTQDSTEVMGWALTDLDKDEADAMIVDAVGIGHGVYWILFEKRKDKVHSISGQGRSNNPDVTFNKRAECYWRLREQFEKRTIRIPDDLELKSQLGSIKFKYTSSGAIQILRKEQIKKVIGHSPDEADALAISYALPDSYFMKPQAKEKIDRYANPKKEKEYSWMGR